VENCYPTHQMHSQISMDERWPNEITALDAAIARQSPWGALGAPPLMLSVSH
jgi:hypothetical protein